MDYIWTWARDVYRPQVRKCLRALIVDGDTNSPGWTPRFRRSISIVSGSTYNSFSQELAVIGEQGGSDVSSHVTQQYDSRTLDNLGYHVLRHTQDAASDSFLRWSNPFNSTLPWLQFSTIKHSDIILFSFHYMRVSREHTVLSNDLHWLNQEDLAKLYHCAMPMSESNLYDLEDSWTGNATMAINPHNLIKVSFIFKTYCQPSDWQLRRDIYCIIWPLSIASTLESSTEMELDVNVAPNWKNLPTQHSSIIRAFHQLRILRGSQSVFCALNNCSLVLLSIPKQRNFNETSYNVEWTSYNVEWTSYNVEWTSYNESPVMERIFTFHLSLFDLAAGKTQHGSSQSGLRRTVSSDHDLEMPPAIANFVHESSTEYGTIAMRSLSCTPQCPKFCFFVSLDGELDDGSILGTALDSVLKAKIVHSDGSWQPGSVDRRELRGWPKALRESYRC
jgi:hypothetical protein